MLSSHAHTKAPLYCTFENILKGAFTKAPEGHKYTMKSSGSIKKTRSYSGHFGIRTPLWKEPAFWGNEKQIWETVGALQIRADPPLYAWVVLPTNEQQTCLDSGQSWHFLSPYILII